jgi:membrane protease YdiL (CAAX protease family)
MDRDHPGVTVTVDETRAQPDRVHEDPGAALRGFGPPGVLAVLVVFAAALAGPVVASVAVLAWAWWSHTPMHALGFRAPRSLALTLIGGAAFGILFKLVMKIVVMPLLGAPPINVPYQYLVGNTRALPAIIATILVSAAVGEEIFFRGYLFERLGTLVGRSRTALAFTVVFSASLFAAAHYAGQGVPGVQQAAIGGLVMGGLFAWRRQIWFLMIAHAAFDLTALAVIYWSWERPLAHLLFG